METKTTGRLLFRTGLALLAIFHFLLLYSPQFQLFFYPLAWWSFILTLEGFNSSRGRGLFIQRKLSYFLYICGVSAFLWFVFEAFNLYIGNWYYVLALEPLTEIKLARWLGAAVCFATVLPGLWEVQRVVFDILPERLNNLKKFQMPAGLVSCVGIIGIIGTVGPLLAPTYLFAFVWLGLLLAVEFIEYRSENPSFLRKISNGKYRLLISWLLAGLICGFLWEFWNHFALTGWIYTVPFMGDWRLFEMPILGYFGFPPFALMVWRLFEFIDRNYRKWSVIGKIFFWLGITIFCILVLTGMEIYTNVPATLDLTKYNGWTNAEKKIILQKNIHRAHKIMALDEPARIKEKTRLIMLGPMGTEIANCLLGASVTTIQELKDASTPRLARRLLECRGGKLSFWKRRVKDWKQRTGE